MCDNQRMHPMPYWPSRTPHSARLQSAFRVYRDQVQAGLTAHLVHGDWSRLRTLPWGTPLEKWERQGAPLLAVRHGESRHVVRFAAVKGRRYALKETSPEAAEREIRVLAELHHRGIHALEPVGWVVVAGAPIAAGEFGGRTLYLSGNVGYCITRLAERVLPQSLLYRYPFTPENKRLLWNAVAELLVSLHGAGCFWGDPSLANILMDLRGRQLAAVLADAETAELVPGPLSEGMRRQDLDALAESLIWQAEDIRIARDLPESDPLVTEGDIAYIVSRYEGLRAERERARERERRVVAALADPLFGRLQEVERRVREIAALGYGVRALRWHAPAAPAPVELADAPPGTDEQELLVATLRPGWYVQRLRELLDEEVPAAYAWRLYHHLNLHKWLLSERAGRDVGLEEAAADWREHISAPTLSFLHSYLGVEAATNTNALYAAFAAILDRAWSLSQEQGRPVPVEEAAMDYALGTVR